MNSKKSYKRVGPMNKGEVFIADCPTCDGLNSECLTCNGTGEVAVAYVEPAE